MIIPSQISSFSGNHSKSCFICGEGQANWFLHSKPNSENKPFFPFIQYQSTPINSVGLDEHGRCITCNVCYLFLTQQWRTYEFNRTPILKRLYWLKRPLNEYTEEISGEDSRSRSQISGQAAITSVTNQSQISRPSQTSQEWENSDFDNCTLCNARDKVCKLKYVFTTPQQTLAIPFYPGLPIDSSCLDAEKRLCLCAQCYQNLDNQWLEYERKMVPLTERKYNIDKESQLKEKSTTVACYICNDILSHDRRLSLYCKRVEGFPYYPFLNNLPILCKAVKIDISGKTYSCENCQSFLKRQWNVFEESKVPQEERVYRVTSSQPPLLPSSVKMDSEISCFICSKRNTYGCMKRIYCNTGANMNLSFLKSFPKNKDGFFSTETGETFVCVKCFGELKQHWMKYRISLFGPSEDVQNSFDKDHLLCEICKSETETKTCMKLNFLPNDTSTRTEPKPFFPILSKFCTEQNVKAIDACQLCAMNLLLQWSAYEENINITLTKMERIYDIEKHACYICDERKRRELIFMIDKQNIPVEISTKGSARAVKIENRVAVCKDCKEKCVKVDNIEIKKNRNPSTSSSSSSEKEFKKENEKESENSGTEPTTMKATATVLPFLNFNMRNQQDGSSGTTSTSAEASEGSFAAALRKLAQQAPGFPPSVSQHGGGDIRHSPSIKNGDVVPSMIPPSHSLHSMSRVSGAPSIMAPHHMYPPHAEKQDPLLKSPYGRPHDNESMIHRERPPHMVPGIFQYQDRDDHHSSRVHKERFETRSKEIFESQHRPVSSSSASNVAAGSLMKSPGMKERSSSSIGLVHPQPVRKHQEEENMKSSLMNPVHFNPRDPTSLRPLSPTEMSRYGPYVTPRSHSHSNSQGSCPVHGHENGGHTHEERTKTSRLPPGLPFDPAHLPREFLHAQQQQHPRLREEFAQHLLQQQHGRHALDRKELHNHAIEEDLRRRGVDYRWSGMPPHILDEHYRRHMINTGHEHSPSYKEHPHGVYVPHFLYGRDHPHPNEHYLPPPTQSELLHRHHGAPVSPRLLEYYRRSEPGFLERARSEYEAERRYEERREKENRMHRTASVESLKRKNEEINHVDRKRMNSSEEKNGHDSSITNGTTKMPIFKGLDYYKKTPPKSYENAQQANSIDSLLHSSKLPDAKTELAAASILANMNINCRVNQSPPFEEIRSPSSSLGTENHTPKPPQSRIERQENNREEIEQSEEKLSFMETLGLVTHSKKRGLEDDYERKRWDRKFRKFRGRPKKRSKRENTEESSLNGDTRSLSELDFYSGPMTRHKQQLLQEQENLLEQIQKRKSTDSNEGENMGSPSGENLNNNQENTNNDTLEKHETSKENSPNSNTSPKPDNNNIEIKHDVEEKKFQPFLEDIKPSSTQTSPVKTEPKTHDESMISPRVIVNNNRYHDNHHYPEHSRHLSSERSGHSQHHHHPHHPQQQQQHSPRILLRDSVTPKHKKQQEIHYDRHLPTHHTSHHSPHGVPSLPPSHPHHHHHHSPHSKEHLENFKALDSSVFGRVMEPTPEQYIRWPGIQPIAHAYSVYHAESESKRRQLLQSIDGLQREGRSLHQKREFLEKDMIVYNEHRMRIAEKRRHMHVAMEGLHSSLRTMSNL